MRLKDTLYGAPSPTCSRAWLAGPHTDTLVVLGGLQPPWTLSQQLTQLHLLSPACVVWVRQPSQCNSCSRAPPAVRPGLQRP